MLELISKYPSDAEVRVTYIDLLITQGEYSQAESVLKRLRDIAPTGAAYLELSVRLAAERGDQAQLNRLLTSLLPNMGGAMSADQLKTVLSVAQTATRYGAIELAGKLYETYVRRVPDAAIELARFLAFHGDCERAVELMKRLYADQTDEVVQLANRMISVRRDEIGDKFDEDVDRLINAALREDPDSIARQLSRAEAYDAEGKYDESIAAYEKLLLRDDLPTRVRAAAMNNLGFLLALLNQRVDDAEELIDRAMETFGPVGDMLDTRAIVRMAQGKYDLAIEDMELALTSSRDPVKYFHLAKAYILAGNGQAAAKAWATAQELGFKKEALPKLEKSQFEQIRQKIESFQAQNVKL
jgi:Tfp pilus assembly protein PilF